MTKIEAEGNQPLQVFNSQIAKTVIVSKIHLNHLLMKTSFNIHNTVFDVLTLENPRNIVKEIGAVGVLQWNVI